MTKLRGAAIGDLLAWTPPEVAARFSPEVTRATSLSSRISKVVAHALKDCGKPRRVVAELMSRELDDTISLAMLEAYASEAKPHQISLERFMALVAVTGCYELIGFVAEPHGFAVVPAKYEDLISQHLLEEHAAEVDQQLAALRARRRGRG